MISAETFAQEDVRTTALFTEVENTFRRLRRPGEGLVSDASDLEVSPDGRSVVFAGSLVEQLAGAPPTRICRVDIDSGSLSILTFGPNSDKSPKFSPDGALIAFLSDRHKAGDFQLYFLDPSIGLATVGPKVQGWIEYFHWSPDGRRILLGVAGHGADVAAAHGAITSARANDHRPDWAPDIDAGDSEHDWRQLWVFDVATGAAERVATEGRNVWEASWCGPKGITAIVSNRPDEGAWYGASLLHVDLDNRTCRTIFVPNDQLGCLAASPGGDCVVLAETVCSDRGFVAGAVRLIDPENGTVEFLETSGVDVSQAIWCSNDQLLLAGHRGLESVVLYYDRRTRTCSERWASCDRSSGGRLLSIAKLGLDGRFVLAGESFDAPPEIAIVDAGVYRTVRSLAAPSGDTKAPFVAADAVTWASADGTEIEGWFLHPAGASGPVATIMNIHGGPVWHWRCAWLGRGLLLETLLRRGFGIFLPNPRGSSGRGAEFARAVCGDPGGIDMADLMAGIDMLVARGFADPGRLGVMGGSYGGFMTSWLVTQTDKFAAAVSVAPHVNQLTERLLSNIPHFVDLFFLESEFGDQNDLTRRSPVLFTRNVVTPTMNVCGALDRCTPPTEAAQFHAALRDVGVPSVLVTYPKEGHGIRKPPATIDFATRVVSWFEHFMPASVKS